MNEKERVRPRAFGKVTLPSATLTRAILVAVVAGWPGIPRFQNYTVTLL